MVKLRSLLLGGLVALIAAVPVLAQDTEVFTSEDGALAFEYPAGWVAQEDGAIVVLANSQEAFDTYQAGDSRAEGMFVALIMSVDVLVAQTGDPTLSDAETPREVLELFTADFESEQEVQEGEIMGFAVANLVVENDEMRADGTEGSVTVLDTPNGMVVMLAETGDSLSDYDDAFELVVTSLLTAEPRSTESTREPGVLGQWAVAAEGSSEYGETSWNAMQAAGEPDTETCGDNITAWASATSTEKASLTLEYETPVFPLEVNIYQTYNPGSIISVGVITVDGETILLPDSIDPVGNTDCPGVFTVDLTEISEFVDGIVINFDQSIGGSWNEIDAVELVGLP